MDVEKYPPPFSVAHHRYFELKRDYENGVIDQDTFQNEINQLVVKDQRGITWRIGADGSWAWHDGQRWMHGDPRQTNKNMGEHGQPGKKRKQTWQIVAGTVVFISLCLCLVTILGTGALSLSQVVMWENFVRPPITEGVEETVSGVIDDLPQVIDIPTPTTTPQPTTVVFSEEQQIVVDAFGWPDSFTIFTVDDVENNTVRLETWNYHLGKISFTFIEGVFSNEGIIAGLPAEGFYPTPYQPDQFPLGASLAFIRERLADNEMVLIKGFEDLHEGMQLYGGQQLILGFVDNHLFYVDAMALVLEGDE